MLHARERGADPQSALDLALDKIDRQVVAFKEKVTHRKQAGLTGAGAAGRSRPRRRAACEPERLRLEAAAHVRGEAVSELEADSQPFVIYLDEDSGEIQILVRRPDGSLAVIEPVVP